MKNWQGSCEFLQFYYPLILDSYIIIRRLEMISIKKICEKNYEGN